MRLTALHCGRYFLFLVLFAFSYVPLVAGQGGVCRVSKLPLEQNKWVTQAKCLLRRVKMNRVIGPELTILPAPLDRLIGSTDVIDKVILKRYLISQGWEEARLGGQIDDPTTGPIANAQYFVIHDTSFPYLKRRELPPNDELNSPDWSRGQLESYVSGKRTHVWVDRIGQSATSRDYSRDTLKAAVKLEDRYPSLRGWLVHTELIQPRKCNPEALVCCRRGKRGPLVCNDAIAPVPGFSEAQLDRLALLYVVASTRRGRWLIPAFHGVVDDEFGSRAHDDPQNFDLDLWASRIQKLLTKLTS